MRIVVGYHRYDTEAELLLLNKIWALQSKLTNYFLTQQKLVSKVRVGAKVSKKYDTATTPHRRAERHETVSVEDKAILADTYAGINPAAVQRQIQALTSELLTLTTNKAAPKTKAPVTAPATRASSDESTRVVDAVLPGTQNEYERVTFGEDEQPVVGGLTCSLNQTLVR